MADIDSALTGALEQAFNPNAAPAAPAAPAPTAAPAPAATQPPAAEPVAEEIPAHLLDPDAPEVEVEAAPEETAPEPEPEFEYEYNGETRKVVGKDAIRAELQKAADYSQKSEQVARVREALAAQIQFQQQQGQFLQLVADDVATLRAIDSKLEEFSKIDWNAAIDSDFTNAMKLQEQRNSLRAMRDAKQREIDGKAEQFRQGQAQASQQLLHAEAQALVAKLPEWRNSEKAEKEQKAIAQTLASAYGFNKVEISGLMDHRMVLVARDAVRWRQLMAAKQDKVKQVREAPQVAKPGATGQDTGRTDFRKAVSKLKEFGTKGNHRAQENLVTAMFDRAFTK